MMTKPLLRNNNEHAQNDRKEITINTSFTIFIQVRSAPLA